VEKASSRRRRAAGARPLACFGFGRRRWRLAAVDPCLISVVDASDTPKPPPGGGGVVTSPAHAGRMRSADVFPKWPGPLNGIEEGNVRWSRGFRDVLSPWAQSGPLGPPMVEGRGFRKCMTALVSERPLDALGRAPHSGTDLVARAARPIPYPCRDFEEGEVQRWAGRSV